MLIPAFGRKLAGSARHSNRVDLIHWNTDRLPARFQLDTGDVAGAAALADEALRIAPDVPAVHSTVGFVRLAQGHTAEAQAAFEAAVAITPLREALVELVALHEASGDDAALADAIAKLDALGPAPVVG